MSSAIGCAGSNGSRRTVADQWSSRSWSPSGFRQRASFDQALDALEQKSAVDPGELARCNARVQRELAAKLAEAEAAIVRGDRDEARAQLRAIDGQYGGLAAPAILDLNARM